MSLVKYRNGATNYFPTTGNTLIDRFLNDSYFDNTTEAVFTPKVDIMESDKAYELHFAVPGFNKDNFELNIDENVLEVSGERKFEEEKSDKKFKSIQTSWGSFKRSFSLPENIAVEKIDAKYNNGILEVVIPKDETKVIKKSIKVK
jgi:HSP20 family protein